MCTICELSEGGLHVAADEVRVSKQKIILSFTKAVDLSEVVHVELPHERTHVPMPKEVGEDFFFQFATTSDYHLVVIVPGDVSIVVVILGEVVILRGCGRV